MIVSPVLIAEACHEANRVLQRANPTPGIPVAPPWSECGAEQQASVINGVVAILHNPDTTPEQSHENWRLFKQGLGWTYGPVKDEQAKTHPCMVDYADLPESDKVKDRLFGAIVRALA